MYLARFARVRFCHAPTPLEPMPRLSRHLGGPDLYVKRDDCTGLAFGGNKTRKLEFLVGDALAQGADHLLTQGAVQSNHVRQTAAAAARFGMKCTGLLEQRVANPAPEYRASGNVFLDRLMGATLASHPAGTDMNSALAAEAEKVRRQGGKPYVIPGGGSNPIGALGYVACAQELLWQADDLGLKVDCIIHGTGSAGTQAGLAAGLGAIRTGIRLLGISVRASREKQEEAVYRLAQATAEYAGVKASIDRATIEVNDKFVGAGYGIPTEEMVEAVTLCARLEGLLLDPVYSGKAMAGLIGLIRAGHFPKSATIVFLHTGGAPALYGYRESFDGDYGP